MSKSKKFSKPSMKQLADRQFAAVARSGTGRLSERRPSKRALKFWNVPKRAMASLQDEAVKKSPKVKAKKSAAKIVDHEAAEAQAFLQKPDGLRVPTFLDRVAGKTKEEIDASREAAIKNAERGAKKSKKLVASGKGKKSSIVLGHSTNLEPEGKTILKEQTAQKEQTKQERIRMLRESEAAKKSVKPEPKKTTAKVQTSTSEKADSVFKMLVRKNGASNSEFVAALGYRWNIQPMTKLCKERGYKLKTQKPDGEPMRYLAIKD